jgi:hypothetical protein
MCLSKKENVVTSILGIVLYQGQSETISTTQEILRKFDRQGIPLPTYSTWNKDTDQVELRWNNMGGSNIVRIADDAVVCWNIFGNIVSVNDLIKCLSPQKSLQRKSSEGGLQCSRISRSNCVSGYSAALQCSACRYLQSPRFPNLAVNQKVLP